MTPENLAKRAEQLSALKLQTSLAIAEAREAVRDLAAARKRIWCTTNAMHEGLARAYNNLT